MLGTSAANHFVLSDLPLDHFAAFILLTLCVKRNMGHVLDIYIYQCKCKIGLKMHLLLIY